MSLLNLTSPNICCLHQNSLRESSNNPNKLHGLHFTRRSAMASVLSSAFIAGEAFSNSASAFDLRITVPDQTVEEAESVIRNHSQDLIGIKPLLESESWREAQLALRESSAYLKQDIYTIIQAKPGIQRALLRKLYSDLFNNVTKLDYAARRKDASVVNECYNNIVTALNEIFAKI